MKCTRSNFKCTGPGPCCVLWQHGIGVCIYLEHVVLTCEITTPRQQETLRRIPEKERREEVVIRKRNTSAAYVNWTWIYIFTLIPRIIRITRRSLRSRDRAENKRTKLRCIRKLLNHQPSPVQQREQLYVYYIHIYTVSFRVLWGIFP